uniref:Uncharacterized protein n=1 Tax=Oryza barthii TaxID=65489 RepID=A0A0D3EJW8_9ORYZ
MGRGEDEAETKQRMMASRVADIEILQSALNGVTMGMSQKERVRLSVGLLVASSSRSSSITTTRAPGVRENVPAHRSIEPTTQAHDRQKRKKRGAREPADSHSLHRVVASDGAAVPLSSRPRASSWHRSPSSLPGEAIGGRRRFFPETAAVSPHLRGTPSCPLPLGKASIKDGLYIFLAQIPPWLLNHRNASYIH